jgi:hypothetical protein
MKITRSLYGALAAALACGVALARDDGRRADFSAAQPQCRFNGLSLRH